MVGKEFDKWKDNFYNHTKKDNVYLSFWLNIGIVQYTWYTFYGREIVYLIVKLQLCAIANLLFVKSPFAKLWAVLIYKMLFMNYNKEYA